MTGAQLKHIRISRGWNLREMANAIGDVSHTSIMRWENNPSEAIPSWIDERLFRTMPITLPLEDLHALLDLAREEGLTFQEMLAGALKSYVAEKKPDNVTGLYSHLTGTEPDTTARVAEATSDEHSQLTKPPKAQPYEE